MRVERRMAGGAMFLRHKLRRKDGKEHRYWSIVGTAGCPAGMVQRHVLYPARGVVPDDRGVRREGAGQPAGRVVPEDCAAPPLDCDVVQVRLSESAASPAAAMGWLSGWRAILWDQLELDDFCAAPASVTKRWLNVLKTLVAYRLIDPGSEWRLHRQWYDRSAMGDLLGEDFTWCRRTICIAASTSCWRTRPICSASCNSAGRPCSRRNSKSCSTI